MGFPKDSMVIELVTAADGYYFRAWKWDQGPPPADMDRLNRAATDEGNGPVHTLKVATDKTELKTELAAIIDTQFDQ